MNEQNNMPPDDNSGGSQSTARSSEASGVQNNTQNNTQNNADATGSDSTSGSSQQQQQQSRRHRRGGGGSGSGGTHDQRRQGQRDAGSSSSSTGSRRPEAAVNMEEVRELVDLIAERGFTDFELEREGFRIRLRRDTGGQSGQQMTSAPFANPFVQTSSAMPSSLPMPSTPTSSATTSDASNQGQTATGGESAATDENLETIKSPIVGTFYRAPSPTAEMFVKVGSAVESSTVVCIIEAMKLMNEILAETSGTIEKIYVENGQPVEYGQPLFGVRKN